MRRAAPFLLGLLAALGLAAPAAAQLAEDRRPVLLVPGWSDTAEHLESLRLRFVEAGWDSTWVRALTFEDPVGSNRAHAREVAAAVNALLEATGASRVDVVAHSMGGLAVRYWLLNGGAERTRRVAFLATPHDGTFSSYLAWGDGADEMRPGSAFLLGLRRGRALPDGVRAVTLRTPLDLHIVPNESATLPGVPDLEVCCPTHAGLLDHDAVFDRLERFLVGPHPEERPSGPERDGEP